MLGLMLRNQEIKIVQAIAYLAEKVNNLTDVKAYKLLWLADRQHLGEYGRTISGDVYYAMERGPVPSHVKLIVNRKERSELFWKFFALNSKELALINHFDSYDYLSETDKKSLDTIISAYGDKSEDELVDISHKSPEWKAFDDLIKRGPKKSYKMSIGDFFIDFDDPAGVFDRNGNAEIAKAIFMGDQTLLWGMIGLPEDIIRSQIEEGKVYRFHDTVPEGSDIVPNHWHIVLRKDNDIVYFLCCTTKEGTINSFIQTRGLDWKTKVHITPTPENGLTEDTFLNCNQVKICEIESLVSLMNDGLVRFDGEIVPDDYNRIKVGILSSAVIEPYIKDLLV